MNPDFLSDNVRTPIFWAVLSAGLLLGLLLSPKYAILTGVALYVIAAAGFVSGVFLLNPYLMGASAAVFMPTWHIAVELGGAVAGAVGRGLLLKRFSGLRRAESFKDGRRW